MSGAAKAPEHPAEPAEGKREKSSSGRRFPDVFKGIENVGKGLYGGIAAITGFTWRRIKGVFGGLWETTGKQFPKEWSRLKQATEYVPPEGTNVISKIIGHTAQKIGGVLGWGVSLPLSVAGNTLEGVKQIGKGLIFGTTSGGGTKESGAAPSAGHEAHAH